MKTILVVDDEPLIRELLEMVLGGDHNIVMAKNGQEALDIVVHGQTPVDAIITDVLMPVKDGVTFVRELRSSSLGTPVVFMTGDPGEYGTSDFQALTPYPVMSKPFRDITMVKATIDGILAEEQVHA